MALADIMNNIVMEPNSGCWLWIGSINKHGYGRVIVGGCGRKGRGVKSSGKRVLAHRHALEVARNITIQKGQVVMHKCDVTCCVNPDHLSVGTQKDNLHDMDLKGRRMTKLTYAQAIEIKDSNESGIFLAKKYNVSPNAISRIRTCKTWKVISNGII